jgi:flagellin-like protein
VGNTVKLLKKGVSPIIATVILVLIAVAAGVMLWLWVSGFASTTPAQQQALNERIRIDAVQISTTDNTTTVTIYVRNMGNSGVKIGAAYILDTTGIIKATNTSTNTNKLPTVSPGSVDTVKVDVSSAGLQPGYAYVAKVVTINGVEATYTFVYTG